MRSSKAGLFLIELIILILFFAVAGAICVRLFVSAHLDSLKGETLNQAVLAAQSAAEAYKAGEGLDEILASLPGAQLAEQGFQVLYDGDWEPARNSGAANYVVQVRMAERGNVGEAQINVVSGGDAPPIYTLTVKKLLE